MPYFETFSKRQKRLERAGQSDVYKYDDLPTPFRHQVIHIWREINEHLNQIHEYTARATPVR